MAFFLSLFILQRVRSPRNITQRVSVGDPFDQIIRFKVPKFSYVEWNGVSLAGDVVETVVILPSYQ